MGIKSFDKLCNLLANGKSDNQKEIFDERQKQIRLHILIEALKIFVAGTIINCIITDFIYRWSESLTAPLLALLMLCVIYYLIRAGIKGSFIGVGGPGIRYVASIVCIILGAANSIRCIKNIYKGETIIMNNGIVTDDTLEIFLYILLIVAGIIAFIFFRKNQMRERQ